MYIVNQRHSILLLTAPVPVKAQEKMSYAGNVVEKVQKISEILKKNPELYEDSEIVGRVLTLTEKCKDREVQKFRNELIFASCCKVDDGIAQIKFHDILSDCEKARIIRSWPSNLGRYDVDKGTLTFTEKGLENLDEEILWGFIEKREIKKLVILTENRGSIAYEERVIQQLIKKKPEAGSLTKRITLKFSGGEELVETKAKLLLCGEFFEGVLGHAMREVQENAINLTESDVTLNGFYGILQMVEVGEKDPDVLEDLYKLACDFLQFSKKSLPEGAFGPAKWIKHYGEEKLKELEIDLSDSPPVPRELLEELDKPSPYFDGKKVSETTKLFFVPKGLTLNNMGELAKSPIEGNKVEEGYSYILDRIKQLHGDITVQESYWALMTTDVIPGNREKSREEQLVLASRVEGYDAPTLLQAAVCNFVEYVGSGKRLFGDEPWTYTCCKEEPIAGWKLVVGGFVPAGLLVDRALDYVSVGVAGVRRQ
ncbi:MAG: hypothetical protein H7A37_03465 [Chlamydiales bacterium]|nr:hypothetical protein [Chlamydiales bacterium]